LQSLLIEDSQKMQEYVPDIRCHLKKGQFNVLGLPAKSFEVTKQLIKAEGKWNEKRNSSFSQF
jgi:hypothetical protein